LLKSRGMQVPVHIKNGRDTVQAYCPDLPGCSASAPTVEEALELLRSRVQEYFTAGSRRTPAGTRIITIEV
jgi:predicted RNase H-like HicB family nuclease